MKKYALIVLALVLMLTSCGGAASSVKSANEVIACVERNYDFFSDCALEMQAFKMDRVYVAYEILKEEKDNPNAQKKLVYYEKESAARTAFTNATLEQAFTVYGFAVIFFQTASDSRQNVLFSYTKESSSSPIQNGFYYSFDSLPSGWWGRSADLKRKDNRYLQISPNGDAWYFTVQIRDHFYYFEKQGALLA
ncbi:MAG: hypothetical protein IKD31_03515 [Clostridia bacterium]|nr:hypothetical protein [Clostridia bacterium]